MLFPLSILFGALVGFAPASRLSAQLLQKVFATGIVSVAIFIVIKTFV